MKRLTLKLTPLVNHMHYGAVRTETHEAEAVDVEVVDGFIRFYLAGGVQLGYRVGEVSSYEIKEFHS